MLLLTAVLVHTTPPRQEANAVVIAIAKIIQEGVKKVIKAVDLMVQRLQNKTIWLQNAQKVLENGLSELKLNEIAQWTEKHRKLFGEYYDELWKVKNALQAYQRIRSLLAKQERIVNDYQRAWRIISGDHHFTPEEIYYMARVYTGILKQTAMNLDQIMMVINSFKTQMTDAKRMELITKAGKQIDQNYDDLRAFNAQNAQLSLNRARSEHEIETVKKLYGL